MWIIQELDHTSWSDDDSYKSVSLCQELQSVNHCKIINCLPWGDYGLSWLTSGRGNGFRSRRSAVRRVGILKEPFSSHAPHSLCVSYRFAIHKNVPTWGLTPVIPLLFISMAFCDTHILVKITIALFRHWHLVDIWCGETSVSSLLVFHWTALVLVHRGSRCIPSLWTSTIKAWFTVIHPLYPRLDHLSTSLQLLS